MQTEQVFFVWVSRHPLSDDQRDALMCDGIPASHIYEVGDVDAFSGDDLAMRISCALPPERSAWSRVVVGVVHPAAALNVQRLGYTVAVARNRNRAPEGEPPRFEFEGWHYYT